MKSTTRFKKILASFPEQPIAVVGDVMLDVYVDTRVDRVSLEAPIPIARTRGETYYPGGAANTAANLAALGVPACLHGVVGSDVAGERLKELGSVYGFSTHGIIKSTARPTTEKRRIRAKRQHIARIDTEETAPLSAKEEAQLLRSITSCKAARSALIFSDYAKGIATDSVIQKCSEAAHGFFVDPTTHNLSRFSGASFLTPNRSEIEALLGSPLYEPFDKDKELVRRLRNIIKAPFLITLGEHGVLVLEGERCEHVPTTPQEVYDVGGAGDTAIAASAAARIAGASLAEAAMIANLAAGIVVGKLGTSVCTREELASLKNVNPK